MGKGDPEGALRRGYPPGILAGLPGEDSPPETEASPSVRPSGKPPPGVFHVPMPGIPDDPVNKRHQLGDFLSP